MKTATRLEFRLPQFQGPLDLLLHLIQKNEMDICDIRIAEITDQYLAYLELMQMLDLDVASEYLVLASTLLYIKSQSMLPAAKRPRVSAEADAREELVRQLLEYKRFKEAADFLRECEDAREEVCTRPPDAEYAENIAHEYRIHATLFDLLAAFRTILERRAEIPPEFPTDIEEEPITVEQKMHEIMLELQLEEMVEFGKFFAGFQTKSELICTFLAILELVRLRQVVAIQEMPFESIVLRLNPNRPNINVFRLTSPYGIEGLEAPN